MGSACTFGGTSIFELRVYAAPRGDREGENPSQNSGWFKERVTRLHLKISCRWDCRNRAATRKPSGSSSKRYTRGSRTTQQCPPRCASKGNANTDPQNAWYPKLHNSITYNNVMSVRQLTNGDTVEHH